ncbi:hypothetical protein PAMC26510_33830 [Caballeronia sordidicola]|uniref:Uncharacterized protein n=1 Tax=Caballeronia sordidicola TaxID=196367 RepID=A0A242M6J8_CABSO|nr:hypothetical protein PAMC26510_33830 [Caballeronia sordidicola]
MTFPQAADKPKYKSRRTSPAGVSRFFYFLAVWCNASDFIDPKVSPVERAR